MNNHSPKDILEENEPFSIFNDIEPLDMLTPVEVIDSITPMDSALDIIGIVKEIISPYNVNANNTETSYLLFKFVLQCQNMTEVPFVAWDDDIERIMPFVKLDHILHIDGPFARPQEQKYSKTNKNYILTIRSNTRINTLGKIKNQIDDESNLREYSSLDECINVQQKIVLKVVLKNEFIQEKDHVRKASGVVTDKYQKVNVIIENYSQSLDIKKGEHVQMIGQFIENSNEVSFIVANSSCVKKIEGNIIPHKDLRKITKVAKRINVNENIPNVKKQKINN